MTPPHRPEIGLKLGVITLVVVMIGFVGLFVFGPAPSEPAMKNERPSSGPTVLDMFPDAPTQGALEALKRVAPGSFTQLETVARRAQADGADAPALADLAMQALFGELQNQALAMRSATHADYQTIVAHLSTGLRQLKAQNSDWCDGAQIAAYLAQNESELIPSLLAEFPYQTPQYDWVMDWMRTILMTAKRASGQPQMNSRPGFRDEFVLQQAGIALGSEQWSLALQIANFANSEGTSYANMQEAIENIDVCALGIAIETVSARLPADVQARIWADLMPEIMAGNTPYVIWRVNDYFFIG